ncbi:homoserine kinase, partial [Candidatus Neomarinimicrobiota bacterium]
DGWGEGKLPTNHNNLIAKACLWFCRSQGWEPHPWHLKVQNPVPPSRGLGSSAAAIVTGMSLAQLEHAGMLDLDTLFQQAAAMEGHPDNVAPAVFGGLQKISRNIENISSESLPLSSKIAVLLVIPELEKSTSEMRAVVPASIPPEVQEENDRYLRQVLQGLASGEDDNLHASALDRRHQPYRLAVQKETAAVFKMLNEQPGIAGAFLSGAGTTIGAWITNGKNPSPAITRAVEQLSISATVMLVKPDPIGIQGEIIHA